MWLVNNDAVELFGHIDRVIKIQPINCFAYLIKLVDDDRLAATFHDDFAAFIAYMDI